MKKKHHKAYKFQVLWNSDAGEQHIDLAHCEHPLEATSDDVLYRERLCLVDLSLEW